MKIFFIWIAILCCGVANGFLYSNFGRPENYAFMLCVSVVCVILLLWHRKVTKNWEAPKDPWEDGFHLPVFRLTLFFSVFALIIFFILRENTETAIVASATIAIASFIAYRKEITYTDDWL